MADQQNSDEIVYTLNPQPGIRRDGTMLDGDNYQDGQWVRFQRNRPKKMGGYRRITADLSGPSRKFLLWSRKDLNSCTNFHSGGIETLLVDNNLVGNDINDRTPNEAADSLLLENGDHILLENGSLILIESWFTIESTNMWTADTQYDDAVGSQGTIIVAHCSKSLENIDDDTATKPFWAMASSSSSEFLVINDAPAVSGGVFCVPPYTFAFGSDGYIAWSDANQPQVWDSSPIPGDAGSDRITGTKIVAGLPMRAQKPAGILWSLDSVIRADWVGGAAVWSFATISTQSSILAQNSVIEYDGAYFWIGVDRFMYFDSAPHELPNDQNQNYFFDNLNYAHRQKIWATKVPRFGEIWWFYPRGDATECSHAIIFNVRMKIWYDVELARSAGFYSQIRHYPTWVNSETEDTGSYGLYQHEFGKNKIVGDVESAIQSYFTTPDFGYPTGGVADSPQGLSRWTRLTRVEPDFIQTGDMTMSLIGYEFAQSTAEPEVTYTFAPTDGKIDVRGQRRHILLKFESNEVDGFYEAGKIIVHTEPGDNRS